MVGVVLHILIYCQKQYQWKSKILAMVLENLEIRADLEAAVPESNIMNEYTEEGDAIGVNARAGVGVNNQNAGKELGNAWLLR